MAMALRHAQLPRAETDPSPRNELTITLPPASAAPGLPSPDAASAAAALMAFAPAHAAPPASALPAAAATMPAPPARRRGHGAPKSGVAPFIRTVFDLVNSPEDNYCEWAEGGRRVVFTDPEKFAEVVCPAHFRHGNWTSFSRMMNMYDFRKISRKPRKVTEGRPVTPMVFEHDHFREGGEAFLHLIIRRKRAQPGGETIGITSTDQQRHAMAEMQQKVVALEIENSYLRSMLAQQHAAHAGYAQAPPGYPGAAAAAPGYPYAAAPPAHGYPYAPAAAPMPAYGYPPAPPQTLQAYPLPPEAAAPLGYPAAPAVHEPPPTPEGQPPGKKSRSCSEDDVSPKTVRTTGRAVGSKLSLKLTVPPAAAATPPEAPAPGGAAGGTF